MKMMSKYPSRHVVKLQGKLKLKKKKILHIPKFLLDFSIFRYISHQPISVAHLDKRKSRETFDILVSTKSAFFKFRFREGGGGCSPKPPVWVCEWLVHKYKYINVHVPM
jgi:hypothetical protein